jgi:hypothetical protein
VSSHFGSWSPDGLPNFHKTISRVKTHWIEPFLTSLESSWNLNVSSELAWSIWTLQTQVIPKRRAGSQIGNLIPTTKSRESPRFPCVKVVWHTPLENLDKGYNFVLDLISIEGLHTKLCAPKVGKVVESQLWEFRWHLGAGPVAKHRVYYKGGGGGFPQFWVVVSLMTSCLLVVRLCTKVLQLRTNQLLHIHGISHQNVN